MPFGMSDLSTTKTVRDWYLYSFIDMLDFGRPKWGSVAVFRSRTYEEAVAFTDLLRKIYDRHSGVRFRKWVDGQTMEMIARSVLTVREQMREKGYLESELSPIKPVLDSFYTSRIGIRIILEQHLSLSEQMKNPIPGYTGIINNNTNPSEVATLAMYSSDFYSDF